MCLRWTNRYLILLPFLSLLDNKLITLSAVPGQLGPGAVGESVFSWTFHAENSTDGWAGAGSPGTIGVANIVEGGYLGRFIFII